MVAPGKAMAAARGRVALWKPLSSTVAGGPSSASANPTTISGLLGWWEAAHFSGAVDGSGRPLSAWYQAAAAVADRSPLARPLTVYASRSSSLSATAVPRLAALYGGIGAPTQESGLMMPALSPHHGLGYGGASPGSSGDWTWWIVWSRPNWRQGTSVDGYPGTILSVGSVPILQIDNRGGGRLTLFPTGSNVILYPTLSRRHTHSVVLRHTVGGGVDAWLDNRLVARGIQNPLPGFPTDPTRLLHDGTPLGAAQCWFHEAAAWGRALSDSEIATVATYAGRWPTGKRRGILLVVSGQSNAINYALNDGAAQLLAQGIAWHVGAAAYNIVAQTDNPSTYTMQRGHGLYPAVSGLYPGSFLAPSGADPSIWPLGQDGMAFQKALQGLSQEDLSDVCALLWPWNETDSLREYSEKGTFLPAAARFLALARGLVGKTAANLPLVWWNAIPYGSDAGTQMHREVSATLAADPATNVVIGNLQTSDSNPRGAAWDPATGLSSGGDPAHRDADDNRRFARLAAPVAARAIMAAGYGDTMPDIPSGVPMMGGPRIAKAFRRDNTSIILAIQHDSGTDIRVPLQAAKGMGFSVMDGGSVTNPGVIVQAISCERLDATHVLVKLAQPLSSPTAGCLLHYPRGSVAIGRGNAITDNHSLVSKPMGWDIGDELGADWNLDYPLAATTIPIPLSDTAA